MTAVEDPVTVFGARVPVRRGRAEFNGILSWLAARWSDCTDYRFDLVAADLSGDLAYIVGFEHIANSVVGVAVEPYTLRVTHIFRREQGAWRIAHRHADYVRSIRRCKARRRRADWMRATPKSVRLSAAGSRARVKDAGRSYDNEWAMIWTLRDGKVAGWQIYEDIARELAAHA